MDKERGLIAGIDLSGTRIQASVYSHNSGSVQSVKLTEDSHEKTNLINVIAECMRATGESQIKSICVTIADYNGDEIAAVMADRAIPPFEIYKIDFELVFLSVYFTLYFGRCQ